MLTAIQKMPIQTGVKAHSVIGRVGKGRVELSNDTVVPYASSHVSWTASELVIDANHFCQDDPRTIAEIRRILLLQLSEQSPR